MYRMQKKLNRLCIKFLLIFFAITFTQVKNAFSKETNGTLEFAIGLNTGTGFEQYSSMYQQIYKLEINKFFFDAGVQIALDSIDLEANAICWFLSKPKVQLGADILYHYMYYDSLSSTHDILPGIYLQARPNNKFGFCVDVHYMYKARTIFAIQEYTGILKNHSIAFSLQTDFYATEKNKIFAKLCSYERFRYNVLCAPSFSVGIKHDMPQNKAYIELEGIARFTDLFTLSAYHDSNELRFAFGMYL